MFEIYSKPGCSYCDKAKYLLNIRNLSYKEYVLDVGQEKDSTVSYYTVEMLKEKVPGAKTVPQIFDITDGKNKHIGGYEALCLLLDGEY